MRKFWIVSTFIVTQKWEKSCLKASSGGKKPVIRETLAAFSQSGSTHPLVGVECTSELFHLQS